MASPFNRYSLYAAQIGDRTFRDIGNVSFRTQSRKSVPIPSGDIHPRAVINCCSDPVIGFTTRDLLNALGGSPTISPATGYKVDTAGSPATAPTLLQFQKRSFGGSFEGSGTSVHTVGTSTRGVALLRSLSCGIDDEQGAQASIEYMPLSVDGYTDPVSWSNASALTSSGLFNGMFYLGPVRIGLIGSSLADFASLQRLEINFGIDFRSPRADGTVFAINGSTYAVIPEIRATFLDHAAKSNLMGRPWGRAFSGSGSAWNFFLRQGEHGGGRIAVDSASHVVITANTGDETVDSLEVNRIDDSNVQVILRPTAGITVATGQLIT